MKKMVTTKEALAILEARGVAVSYSNLVLWVRSGKFPGAESKLESRGPVWLIPEASVEKFKPPKKGRPLAAKRATGQKNSGNASSSKKKGGKK